MYEADPRKLTSTPADSHEFFFPHVSGFLIFDRNPAQRFRSRWSNKHLLFEHIRPSAVADRDLVYFRVFEECYCFFFFFEIVLD